MGDPEHDYDIPGDNPDYGTWDFRQILHVFTGQSKATYDPTKDMAGAQSSVPDPQSLFRAATAIGDTGAAMADTHQSINHLVFQVNRGDWWAGPAADGFSQMLSQANSVLMAHADELYNHQSSFNNTGAVLSQVKDNVLTMWERSCAALAHWWDSLSPLQRKNYEFGKAPWATREHFPPVETINGTTYYRVGDFPTIAEPLTQAMRDQLNQLATVYRTEIANTQTLEDVNLTGGGLGGTGSPDLSKVPPPPTPPSLDTNDLLKNLDTSTSNPDSSKLDDLLKGLGDGGSGGGGGGGTGEAGAVPPPPSLGDLGAGSGGALGTGGGGSGLGQAEGGVPAPPSMGDLGGGAGGASEGGVASPPSPGDFGGGGTGGAGEAGSVPPPPSLGDLGAGSGGLGAAGGGLGPAGTPGFDAGALPVGGPDAGGAGDARSGSGAVPSSPSLGDLGGGFGSAGSGAGGSTGGPSDAGAPGMPLMPLLGPTAVSRTASSAPRATAFPAGPGLDLSDLDRAGLPTGRIGAPSGAPKTPSIKPPAFSALEDTAVPGPSSFLKSAKTDPLQQEFANLLAKDPKVSALTAAARQEARVGALGEPGLPSSPKFQGGGAGAIGARTAAAEAGAGTLAARTAAAEAGALGAAGRLAGAPGAPGAAGTYGGMPYMPPMGGMGQGQRPGGGERERTTWLLEDEDVWGAAEQDATDGVIGRPTQR
ncbi:hypothetical protein BX265_6880 [Streptomyces sp. TLI_235]|nr:hypothetical protein [Streptomyces sp. TLI_235]PBC69551.1 hypothetical protein BX265_6880 [Streptomyces sp. TLI_235]